ncbi:MAG: LytTR family DNA-binding domain-containing protein [Bacteroidales bacterium]|nr:LytTR family DNA-binding domain-containing protein [Bacteroidales bacterium]MDD4770724.1 LytTR family DNA-binding domain-containing protein [Bacteroidales bacterium]
MLINCIAIEDEPLALNKIKGFIGQVDYLNLLEGFSNAVDAIGFLKKNPVDLIFLDIRMKGLSGIQFLESIQLKSKVIITSAYDAYALKGFELDVADYLLKPFTFERFLKSVEKVYSHLDKEVSSNASAEFIFVKTEYRIEKVVLKDILYIQGMKDYLQIHTVDKHIMTLQTFKNVLDVLPEADFQRVHHSYIVSISKIEHIERNRLRIGKELIPVSDSYKDRFFGLLRERKMLV